MEDCFSNASLFHKALKEAFESFCNKQIASATMAQLMADYCNTLLKKVRPPLAATLRAGSRGRSARLALEPRKVRIENVTRRTLPLMQMLHSRVYPTQFC